ncbi:MAG: PEP-CTERM sorting domain-containing protein [Opitutaceae bacterium]|nr:PEP-CTERM sorting domain-containing protein [Opitutaceae bacterium]
MQTKVLLRLATLAAACAGLVPAAHAQSVIYREIFGLANPNPNAAMNTFGWFAYASATATNQTFNGTTFGISPEIGGSPSNLASLAGVNNGPATPAGVGRTFFGLGGAGGIFLAYTEEHVVNRSAFNITSVSWEQRNDGPALGVAVRIGGAWYASSTVPGGGGGTAWSTASLDFANTTWSALNFAATSQLSVGATTTLPSGNIDAFGLYAPEARGTTAARIDAFTIQATAVPEPASFAALAGMACLGAAALRRRGPRTGA